MSFLSLLHRCPTPRANAPWYLSLAAMGLVSWSASGALAQDLTPPQPPPVTFTVQDTQPATQPPTLPETRVEAQPPTLPQTNVEGANPTLIDPNGGYDPAIDGTPFASRIGPGYRQSQST